MSAAGLRAALGLALAAACFAIYAQVRHHEFVDYDDYITIVHNDALAASSLPDALRVAVTPHHANWIPLTTLSFVFDRWLHGGSAQGHLLGNVALHALASVLLFLALDAMTGATKRSAFVAALFAVHPLHVESVAWANERKDVLCGFFFMLTLRLYAGSAARPGSWLRQAGWLACGGLALLAKPMAVTLPCVLLLLDFWPLRRLSLRAWLEKLPLFAAALAIALVAIAAQQSADSLAPATQLPVSVRVANAIDATGAYLRQSVWPSGLAAFYPYTGGSASGARVAIAGGLVAVSAAAFALRRTRPYLIVGWLWFLGMLVPVIGLVQVGPQGRADRYMYLPQIGLALAVTWGAGDLARSRGARRALAVGGVAVLAAFAAVAWLQVGYWRNSFALFERMLAISPDAYLPHERLATLHLRAGRIDQARLHYQRAYEIDPEQGRGNLVRFELGSADSAIQRSEPDAAIELLRAALRADPENARAQHLLARSLAAQGRSASAGGRQADAVEQFRAALQIDPTFASARNDLAWLLATAADPALRSPAEAVALAELSSAVGGTASANELDTLAAAYAAAGRFDDAQRIARQALALARRDAAELAPGIETRLRAYERAEPWVEPALPKPAPPRPQTDAIPPAGPASPSPRARTRGARRRGSRARAPRPLPTRASAGAA